MADFDIAANLVLKQEGGYVNNPDDPGGETNYGISKRTYPGISISTLTPDSAKSIYRSDYWSTFWLDLPQELANLMLSLSVNVGKVGAISIAQKALGIPPDGKWGPLTQGIAQKTPQAAILIGNQAIRYYISLDKAEFLSGWITRVLEAFIYALK